MHRKGSLKTVGSVDIQNVYEQIKEIAERYDVQKIVLFGSRARGTNGPKSDIDLAVYGCEEFEQFSDFLQENLWSLLKLDMIDMRKQVSEELKREIDRDGVMLYEKV